MGLPLKKGAWATRVFTQKNFHEERFALTKTNPHKDNTIAGAPNNSQNNMSNKSEIYYHAKHTKAQDRHNKHSTRTHT